MLLSVIYLFLRPDYFFSCIYLICPIFTRKVFFYTFLCKKHSNMVFFFELQSKLLLLILLCFQFSAFNVCLVHVFHNIYFFFSHMLCTTERRHNTLFDTMEAAEAEEIKNNKVFFSTLVPFHMNTVSSQTLNK
jgi:hypothetical protein